MQYLSPELATRHSDTPRSEGNLLLPIQNRDPAPKLKNARSRQSLEHGLTQRCYPKAFDRRLTHLADTFRLFQPSVRPEFVCIFAESLFMLVNDPRIRSNNGLNNRFMSDITTYLLHRVKEDLHHPGYMFHLSQHLVAAQLDLGSFQQQDGNE